MKAVVGLLVAILTPGTVLIAESLSDPTWSAEQAKTVNDLRNVGTCLASWWLAEFQSQRTAADDTVEGPTLDLSSAPIVSWQELAEVIVPACLSDLPAADGWGHPYEYRLSRDPNAPLAIALRSMGADGRFSGSVYEVGAVRALPDEDVVWADGIFVQHPPLGSD